MITPPMIRGQARRLMPAALRKVPASGADSTARVEPATWTIEAVAARAPAEARSRSARGTRRASRMTAARVMAAAIHQAAAVGRGSPVRTPVTVTAVPPASRGTVQVTVRPAATVRPSGVARASIQVSSVPGATTAGVAVPPPGLIVIGSPVPLRSRSRAPSSIASISSPGIAGVTEVTRPRESVAVRPPAWAAAGAPVAASVPAIAARTTARRPSIVDARRRRIRAKGPRDDGRAKGPRDDGRAEARRGDAGPGLCWWVTRAWGGAGRCGRPARCPHRSGRSWSAGR
ncbi:hypothetical protein MB27_17460 [Actinoplanes utahensis]|uniref:Uncharacterized protein n=1 Tax=Actinoplanes utahensis TaxID=1869 RepID=A0A0A6UM18_ACTUT|nr:hypothetical protein MB27_17460 [Actinoplanes utahensis]